MTVSSTAFHSDQLDAAMASGTNGKDAAHAGSPASTPVKNNDSTTTSTTHKILSSPTGTLTATSDLPIALVRSNILNLSALVGQLSSCVLQHLPLDSSSSSSCSNDIIDATFTPNNNKNNNLCSKATASATSTTTSTTGTGTTTTTTTTHNDEECIIHKDEHDDSLPSARTYSPLLSHSHNKNPQQQQQLLHAPPEPPSQHLTTMAMMQKIVSKLWLTLMATASLLELHLPTCILQKMELNRLKYPVHLCRGKAAKYTEYSASTGITKECGQTTWHRQVDSVLFPASNDSEGGEHEEATGPFVVVPTLTTLIREFAQERHWSKYHLPRNLVLALLGELGELAELVQWDGDQNEPLTREQLDKLSQELADVSIYLLRLADICGWTLG